MKTKNFTSSTPYITGLNWGNDIPFIETNNSFEEVKTAHLEFDLVFRWKRVIWTKKASFPFCIEEIKASNGEYCEGC